MTDSPSPEAPKPAPGTEGANRTTIIAIVVAVVAVMIALLAVATRPGGGTTQPSATATITQPSAQPSEQPTAQQEQPQVPAQLSEQQRAGIERRQDGDVTALGSVDAPVVMVEYSDYSCPYCGRFARETKPELVREYVETGVLRMEWRDYPVMGEHSPLAAAAARAAGLQGRYWEFNTAVYTLEPGTPPTLDKLLPIAQDLGLDVEKFRADLATDQIAQAIQADYDEGRALGVNSTPTFFINGTLVQGALPLEQFEQVIDQHAQAAG